MSTTTPSTTFTTMPIGEILSERVRAREQADLHGLRARQANDLREVFEATLVCYSRDFEYALYAPLSVQENMELLCSSEQLLAARSPPLDRVVWAYHIGLASVLREVCNRFRHYRSSC